MVLASVRVQRGVYAAACLHFGANVLCTSAGTVTGPVPLFLGEPAFTIHGVHPVGAQHHRVCETRMRDRYAVVRVVSWCGGGTVCGIVV